MSYFKYAFVGAVVGLLLTATFGAYPGSSLEDTYSGMLVLGAGVGLALAHGMSLSQKHS